MLSIRPVAPNIRSISEIVISLMDEGMLMLPQQLKLSDITDERTAQLYIDQIVMVAFCRVLDKARLSPDVVMRMLATALGGTYRQVAAAHLDGQCPCGWSPSADDIETMRVALGGASTQVRRDDLQSMAVAGRA